MELEVKVPASVELSDCLLTARLHVEDTENRNYRYLRTSRVPQHVADAWDRKVKLDHNNLVEYVKIYLIPVIKELDPDETSLGGFYEDLYLRLINV